MLPLSREESFALVDRVILMMWVLALALFVVLVTAVAANAEWAKVADEWPDVTPSQKDWFIKQHNAKGFLCCSVADGHPTDWDVRDGKYWAVVAGEWRQIPDEDVIDVPNPVGRAVIWWSDTVMDDKGKKMIRCFIPGPGA